MTTDRGRTCKARIKEHLKSRIEDFESFLKIADLADELDIDIEDINNKTKDDFDEKEDREKFEKLQKIYDELGVPNEYGLALTKESQNFIDETITWRYELSWGGPSDEFEIEKSGNEIIQIIYRFKDWFDGAKLILNDTDDDFIIIRDFIERFLYLED